MTESIDIYDMPNTLVFLSLNDYERLNADGAEFVLDTNDGDHRNPFERDRARVIHSPFFRSLAGKSQIFSPGQSDFLRNRLTHSLEVAQIAKVMIVEFCHKYRLSKVTPELSYLEQTHLCDLVEAVCLGHDIGHPPFGHIGEDGLHEIMTERDAGGFEANAQNIRILTTLDYAYSGRPGFTRGVLAGVMKYKIKRSAGYGKFIYDADWYIAEMACPQWNHDVALSSLDSSEFTKAVKQSQSLACQVMDLADEISYAGHDIEDVLHTSMLQYGEIKAIESLSDGIDARTLTDVCSDIEMQSGYSVDLRSLQDHWDRLKADILEAMRSPNSDSFPEATHRLRRQHMNSASASCTAVNNNGTWRIVISETSAARSALIRRVVVPMIYVDSRLVTMQRKGLNVVRMLMNELLNSGGQLLPLGYRERFDAAASEKVQARLCCDYLDSLTEEYLLRFHQRIFGSAPSVLMDFF